MSVRNRSNGSVSLDGTDPSTLPLSVLSARVNRFKDRPRHGFRRPKIQNWARSFSSKPSALLRPRSEQDLRFIIALAKREKRTIRLIGAIHSPSDLALADDNGWAVSISALAGLFEVDAEKNTVTVGAGISLSHFIALLKSLGTPLALPTLGSIDQQSLAGAISTATHGSGHSTPTLSSYVQSLTLILADDSASVVTVARDSPHEWQRELFKASLCGLGCTGAIVRVKIQCVKSFNLEEVSETWGIGEVIENVEEIRMSSEHSRIYWVPHVGKAVVKRANQTRLPADPEPSIIMRAYTYLVSHVLHQIGLFICTFFPFLLTLHAHLMFPLMLDPTPSIRLPSLFQRSPPKSLVKRSSPSSELSIPLPISISPARRIAFSPDIFKWDILFRQYTFEGRIPVAQGQACLQALRDWLEPASRDLLHGDRFHFPVEVRFTGKDKEGNEGFLSPNWDGDGIYIGTMIYKPYGRPFPHTDIFSKFEHILSQHGGRAHWAKEHHGTPDSLRREYKDFDRYRSVCQRVDPDGVFTNRYTREQLGLGRRN